MAQTLAFDVDGAGQIFPVPAEGAGVPRFGDFNVRWGRITISLAAARTRELLQIGGTLLWCDDASSDVANVNVSFADDSLDVGPIYRKGTVIAGTRFGKVYLTNAAQAGATITLSYCVEAYGQMRIVNAGINTTSIGLTANSQVGTIADVAVAAAATSIVPADANRRQAYITNSGANPMRVGDANVLATRGALVPVGGSITIGATAQIFAFGVGGATTANITTESL